MHPTDSSVVITGASDGIGRALAISFAKRGLKLGLIARRQALLEDLKKLCIGLGSPQVEIRALDVTDSGLLREALLDLDRTLRQTDIFIANAGIDLSIHPTQDGGKKMKTLMDVNVIAAMDGLECMKSLMVTRRSGTLVGVTSVAGARGLPGAGIYCASKAALHAYLESLRTDLKPYQIHVCAITPGFIRTPMTQSNDLPKPFMIPAEQAGELFAKSVLKKKFLIVEPWQFKPMFWFLRALPDFLFKILSTLASLGIKNSK